MIVLTENDISPKTLTALKDLETDDAVLLTTARRKFVIVPEEEYNAWQETNYLLSTKANRKALEAAMGEKIEDGIELNDAIRRLESNSH